mgnify:CR=1 FL=1
MKILEYKINLSSTISIRDALTDEILLYESSNTSTTYKNEDQYLFGTSTAVGVKVVKEDFKINQEFEYLINELGYNLTKAKLPALKVIKRKALPKRKTKRKFSAKQLAAQRLFAKRARAGTLRKRRKR